MSADQSNTGVARLETRLDVNSREYLNMPIKTMNNIMQLGREAGRSFHASLKANGMIEIQTGHVRFIPRTLQFTTKNHPAHKPCI
jgi:hypothetical protein